MVSLPLFWPSRWWKCDRNLPLFHLFTAITLIIRWLNDSEIAGIAWIWPPSRTCQFTVCMYCRDKCQCSHKSHLSVVIVHCYWHLLILFAFLGVVAVPFYVFLQTFSSQQRRDQQLYYSRKCPTLLCNMLNLHVIPSHNKSTIDTKHPAV